MFVERKHRASKSSTTNTYKEQTQINRPISFREHTIMTISSDNDEDLVISIITNSLVRLCGGDLLRNGDGGKVPVINNQNGKHELSDDGHGKRMQDVQTLERSDNDSISSSRWKQQLLALATKSVSFPNGTNGKHEKLESRVKSFVVPSSDGHYNCNNGDNNGDDIGKGHNIESRIALTIFRRYTSTTKKKSKKKRRLGGKECVPLVNNENQSYNASSMNKGNSLVLTSDLGLIRIVQSAHELAKLIVQDIEDQLWYQRTAEYPSSSSSTETMAMNQTPPPPPSLPRKIPIKMIQSNDSGMICIVTTARYDFLQRIDRHPCLHCTKWCKGQKGLWWHEQLVHGLDHSTASTIAASSYISQSNSLAIVLYNHGGSVTYDDEIVNNNTQKNKEQNDGTKKKIDKDPLIESIQNGHLEKFKLLLQQKQKRSNNQGFDFDPTAFLDKNGASLLHWAAGCGHLDVVQYLVETLNCPPDQGQKGKRSFHGRTGLHWSARNGHLHVVKYLIEECSVDIDATTIDGTTAFW